MGFLTPILIYNDCIHFFKDKKIQKQICEKMYSACLRQERQTISIHSKNVIYSNYIESLGNRHADYSRVIVIYGNTWTDITNDIYKSKEQIEERKDYLKKCLSILEYEIKKLKSVLKNTE